MIGSVIFLTITALPDSEAATSFVLMWRPSKRRRIASATAAPSMIAPSTMLSGGSGSVPNTVTLKDLPAGLSSTALTADEPISSPTRALALRNTDHPGVHSCGCIGISSSASEVPPPSPHQFRQNCAKLRSSRQGVQRRAETIFVGHLQFCHLKRELFHKRFLT